MTTLAIVGGGLMGRSLIYTLAKEQKYFEKIVLFSSDQITIPCTLNSTAIVARRGITRGHSRLGDLLFEGHELFSDHVISDRPHGIETVTQYNGALTKLDTFLERFPNSSLSDKFFNQKFYLSEENAFMVDPRTYINWLLNESKSFYQNSFETLDDMVIDILEEDRVYLKTLNGNKFEFDKVIFAGGSYNRFWASRVPDTKLNISKPVQGSYLEFNHVPWDRPSFSLTLEGDNLIWNNPLKRLFIGSTTNDSIHYLPPKRELTLIYERLSQRVNLKFPPIERSVFKVGLREKAQKREPYIIEKGRSVFVGGLYKNAFTLALKLARTISLEHL